MASTIIGSVANTSPASTTNSFAVDATGADAMFVQASTTGVAASGATFNGVALTALWNAVDSGAYAGSGWLIVTPNAGSHTLTVTYPSAVDSAIEVALIAGCVTSSVAASHRTVTSASGGGGGQPSVAATSVTGDLVLNGCCTGSGTMTAGQTLVKQDLDVFGNSFSGGIEKTTAAGASTTMTWSSVSGGTFWVAGSFAMIDSAGTTVALDWKQPLTQPTNHYNTSIIMAQSQTPPVKPWLETKPTFVTGTFDWIFPQIDIDWTVG